jgi:RecB family exonuclease
MFNKNEIAKYADEEFSIKYNFSGVKVSATSLKTYLTCKRKYFYKYIKKIKSHEIPNDMPQEYEIGNDVHKALKELYSKNKIYTDKDSLLYILDTELDKLKTTNEFHSYLIELQKNKLRDFAQKEIERFKARYKVFDTEKYIETMYDGIILQGYIDRIDIKDEKLYILDYKTGNYTIHNKNSYIDAVDFQLEFYYLLASSTGDVAECAFYDLNEMKTVSQIFFQEKIDILKKHLKELKTISEIKVSKCEDTKNCSYCEYAILCNR